MSDSKSTLHLTSHISAPREKVWDVMLSDATYRVWSSAFMPGSYYRGKWDEGSKILFLGPNPDGSGEGGMVSRITKNRPHEFVSIEHRGIIKNGIEDTESDTIKIWAGSSENYTFADKDGGTELTIDMNLPASEKAALEEMWKKALEKIKELAEK